MATRNTKKKVALLEISKGQTVQKEIPVPSLVTVRSRIRPEHIKTIQPLTDTQQKLFDTFKLDTNIVLDGFAGCGKTFVTLYLALREVLLNRRYKKVVIIRSIVPSRDIGFLPGSLEEKIAVYEAPYISIFAELLAREIPDVYKKLQEQQLIEFMPTSFLRGTTINDAIIVVDEAQNLNFAEADTVITRVGANSKLVLCGDYNQSDLDKKDKDGYKKILSILKSMYNVTTITFTEEDIVRSEFVKSYIIAKNRLGISS